MKTLISGGRTRTASFLDGDTKCGWGELKGTGGRDGGCPGDHSWGAMPLEFS